jgi:general secretion pathway protein M
MMDALPTGRAGRLLAVGLLGAVLLSGWFAAAAPLLAWHAERAEALIVQHMQAQRMEALAQALPELQEMAASHITGSGPPSLLEGATDAIAGAALQGLLQEMAAQAGATLTSIETRPPATAGSYRRIGLRLSLAAPWPVLMRLLQAVTQARPHMVIDELELHNSQMLGDRGEVLLSAAFVAYAFRADTRPVGGMP